MKNKYFIVYKFSGNYFTVSNAATGEIKLFSLKEANEFIDRMGMTSDLGYTEVRIFNFEMGI